MLLLIALLPCVALFAWYFGREAEPSIESLLDQARIAAAQGRDDVVLDATERILERDPHSVDALELWAPHAWDRGDRESVVRRLAGLDEATEGAGLLLSQAGSLAIELGWAVEAEDCLLRAIAANPTDHQARNRLAYLYGVEGRAWEMQTQLFELLRLGQGELDHLLMLEAGEPVARDDNLVERCRHARPEESLVLLGPARSAVFEGRAADAIDVLRRITDEHPDVADAWAQLGLALLDTEPEALVDWEESVPQGILDHPEVRYALGVSAKHNGDAKRALDHLAVAVRLDPDHRAANYQFARLLESLGHREQATRFGARAELLRELASAVDKSYRTGGEAHFRRCVELTESLDRPWETAAWCRLSINRFPNADWVRAPYTRLQRDLASNPPRSIGPPVPDPDLWGGQPGAVVANRAEPRRVGGSIRFREVAQRVGVEFVFETRGRQNSGPMQMYESFGGGVAVLDFDSNGLPDLLLVQGSTTGGVSAHVSDRLFRNVGASFVDVTTEAGVTDGLYGSAAAAGDIDGDGFSDLFITNLGRNRLLLNNGDGTFTDVTDAAGLDSVEWSTSAAIADLNGDGLADLYEVNYLDFETGPYTDCPKGREADICGPSQFEAANDRLWINDGRRFRDHWKDVGAVEESGKGLGVVVGHLDDDPRLDLFVANDGEANYLLLNRTGDPGAVRFAEQGLVAGVAVDRDGLVQACMGVAADDVTGNGRIDLFVTNFSDQSNTLYAQESAGLFDDATRRAALRTPSFAPLGFGTQFLDADLDSWPDLAVANGHVFDLSELGGEFRMKPQFFRNLGSGRFEELASRDVGEYFATRQLGRGMARLDWNGDGREEFVVSNIGSTASVLVNESEPVGNWIAVRLVDTIGERTAIGTRVSVRTSGRDADPGRTRQLLAGDGYQASNERQLVFGLPERPTHVDLTVVWPDGAQSEYDEIPAASHWLVVRGSERPLALPSH